MHQNEIDFVKKWFYYLDNFQSLESRGVSFWRIAKRLLSRRKKAYFWDFDRLFGLVGRTKTNWEFEADNILPTGVFYKITESKCANDLVQFLWRIHSLLANEWAKKKRGLRGGPFEN